MKHVKSPCFTQIWNIGVAKFRKYSSLQLKYSTFIYADNLFRWLSCTSCHCSYFCIYCLYYVCSDLNINTLKPFGSHIYFWCMQFLYLLIFFLILKYYMWISVGSPQNGSTKPDLSVVDHDLQLCIEFNHGVWH